MSASHPFLRDLFASARRHFLAVAIFSFFVNILMLMVPMYLLQLYDRVIPSKNVDTLIFLTGIVLVGLFTMTLLDAIRGLVLVKFGTWFDDQVSKHVLSGTISRSLKNQRSSSSNIFNDLSVVRSFFSGSTLFPILDAPWTPVYIFILFLLHPLIGGLTLVGALVLIVLALVTELVTRYHVRQAQGAANVANDASMSIVRNADAVEAMGMRAHNLERWAQLNRTALKAHQAAGVRSVWSTSASKLIRHILLVAVIGSAAWLVLQGEVTAGALIASMLLMRRALSPFDRAIASWKSVLNTRNAYRRINERLKSSPTLDERSTLAAPSGRLKVDRLSFTHRRQKSRTLRDISFRVQPGQVVGLVGPTGAGKSTLAKLLVGTLRPGSGAVYWGNAKVHRWDSDDLGQYIGYLPQDVELFPGTVGENIARMQSDRFEQVIEAAELAGVDRLIEQLPKGYDTQIGDGGAYLSGGQRQRIALARAVFGNARLIVLDEPDANLDSEGKRALARAIERLKERKAMVILISHQASNQQHVDKFLALRNGRLKLSTVTAGDKGRAGGSPQGVG